MSLWIKTACTEQWRLDKLDKIIDSMEDEIEEAITRQQIQTSQDYINIVLSTAGKAIVSIREIIHLSAFGYFDGLVKTVIASIADEDGRRFFIGYTSLTKEPAYPYIPAVSAIH